MPYKNQVLNLMENVLKYRPAPKDASRMFGDNWAEFRSNIFTPHSAEEQHRLLLTGIAVNKANVEHRVIATPNNRNIAPLPKSHVSSIEMLRMVASMGNLQFQVNDEEKVFTQNLVLANGLLNRLRACIEEGIASVKEDIEEIMSTYAAFFLNSNITNNEDVDEQALQTLIDQLLHSMDEHYDRDMPFSYQSTPKNKAEDLKKLKTFIIGEDSRKIDQFNRAKKFTEQVIRSRVGQSIANSAKKFVINTVDIKTLADVFYNECLNHFITGMEPYRGKASDLNHYINMHAVSRHIMNATDTIFDYWTSNAYLSRHIRDSLDTCYRSLSFAFDNNSDPLLFRLSTIANNRFNAPFPKQDPTQDNDFLEMELAQVHPDEYAPYTRMIKYNYALAKINALIHYNQFISDLSKELDRNILPKQDLTPIIELLLVFQEQALRLNTKIVSLLAGNNPEKQLELIDEIISRMLNLTLHAKAIMDILNEALDNKTSPQLTLEVHTVLIKFLEQDRVLKKGVHVRKSELEIAFQPFFQKLQPSSTSGSAPVTTSLFSGKLSFRPKSSTSNSSSASSSSTSSTSTPKSQGNSSSSSSKPPSEHFE